MRLRKIYILIPFVGVLCFYLLLLMDRPGPPLKSLQTRAIIRDVYSELSRMSNDKQPNFRQLLNSDGEDKCLSRLLCDLIKDAWAGYSQSNSDHFDNNRIIDAWGNQLCVAWRSDITTKASLDLLNSADYELLIWSSGKNGIDELGHNDDVLLWIPHKMK